MSDYKRTQLYGGALTVDLPANFADVRFVTTAAFTLLVGQHGSLTLATQQAAADTR